ncbi:MULTISPECIES: DUF2513 domain-containing protein [Enterobacterales]|uniref:DUF2513 domain-containing protein n=1 Tax=Enterobacterales TaxID=91347 RepID=UPI002ED93570
MKRDWDLLRKMLVDVEEENDFFAALPAEPQSDAYSHVELYLSEYERWEAACNYFYGHTELLLDSELITGIQILSGGNGYHGFKLTSGLRLTSKGHDLLDTMRTPVLWESIKSTAKKKGVELSFDAVKVLGVAALKHLVG